MKVKRPLIGLMPKEFHDEKINCERFTQVCEAIQRYWDAGMKIPLEWVQEHNDLVDYLNSRNINHNDKNRY